MFGFSQHVFAVTLTKDIEVRQGDSGDYCYFTGAINYRSTTTKDGEKVTPPPEFVNFAASGFVCRPLRDAKKGDILFCRARMRIRTHEVEKDGKKVVYSDPVFWVESGAEVIRPVRNGASASASAPAASSNAAGKQNPAAEADGFDDIPEEAFDTSAPTDYNGEVSAAEQGIMDQLPY